MSLNFAFQGKVIAVTGGASGIGLATVKLLSQAGARLAIADMQKESLDEVVGHIHSTGGEAVGFCVDVSDAQQVQTWIQETCEKFGQLNGAANIAAIIGTGINKNRVEEIEDDDWARVLSVNLGFNGSIPALLTAAKTNTAAAYAKVVGINNGTISATQMAVKEAVATSYHIVYLVAIAFGVVAITATFTVTGIDESNRTGHTAVHLEDDVVHRETKVVE